MREVIQVTTAIAVALYNGQKFLKTQLDCLKNQTKRAEQVILCDDGSTDNTVEIVENYICQHNLESSWKLLKNDTNLGYIKNFYQAISLCDAELVFLSDQDDLWKEDKIYEMSKVMEQNADILLLSCKYGIIDAHDNQMSSILEENVREDYQLKKISVKDIMRAYRWPGMVMCIRKTFFNEIIDYICQTNIPHDLALAICAADKEGFYEYDYVGAYHRRHDNNTAREEHRISKVLNLTRKLHEIAEAVKNLEYVIDAKLPISQESYMWISDRLSLQRKRQSALKNKSLKEIIKLYTNDSQGLLRKISFICDLWLVCFSKRL